MQLNINETMNSTLKNVKNMSANFSKLADMHIEYAFIKFAVLNPLEQVKLALSRGESAQKEIEYLKKKSGLFFDTKTKTVFLNLNKEDENLIKEKRLNVMLNLLELQPDLFPEVKYSNFLNKETDYKALKVKLEGSEKSFFVFKNNKNKDLYKIGVKEGNKTPKIINLFWLTKEEAVKELLKTI